MFLTNLLGSGEVESLSTLSTYHFKTVAARGTVLYVYDMIYLLTAIGLSPGGSNTHLHKQYIEQHNNFGRARAVPRLG